MNIVKLATCGAIFGAAMLLFVGGASAQTAFNSTFYDAKTPITKTAPTVLGTLAVTAPASGCPCRAIASYFVPLRSGGTRGAIDAWVSDGLDTANPTFAASTNTFTINTNSQLGATDTSSDVYTDSEAVTFTLNIQGQQPVNNALVTSPISGVQNYFKVFFVPDITPAG